jgi:hypothetical protein
MAKKKAKVLSEKQLEEIERHSSWLTLKNIELKCSKLELENKHLRAQAELKEMSTKTEMLKKSIDDKIKLHKSYLKEIAEKLNITGMWSFDPLTGEVKED